MDKAEIQIWIAINETGDFVVNVDSASDALQELQDSNTNDASRVFELNLKLPLPKVISVQAEIPEQDGPVTVTVG